MFDAHWVGSIGELIGWFACAAGTGTVLSWLRGVSRAGRASTRVAVRGALGKPSAVALCDDAFATSATFG